MLDGTTTSYRAARPSTWNELALDGFDLLSSSTSALHNDAETICARSTDDGMKFGRKDECLLRRVW